MHLTYNIVLNTVELLYHILFALIFVMVLEHPRILVERQRFSSTALFVISQLPFLPDPLPAAFSVLCSDYLYME